MSLYGVTDGLAVVEPAQFDDQRSDEPERTQTDEPESDCHAGPNPVAVQIIVMRQQGGHGIEQARQGAGRIGAHGEEDGHAVAGTGIPVDSCVVAESVQPALDQRL
jgi:hypothetical protein